MPEPTTPLSEEAAKDEAERLIRDAYQTTAVRIEAPDIPSYKDGPRIGTTPPVPQPDSRLVPQWALGVAVGSVGVGAGTTGLGCAVWLACKGLSSVIHSLSTVTLAGVLTVAIPFAGLAMLATAIGGAISKAKQTAPPQITNNYNGPVQQENNTRITHTRAVWSKTINRH